MGYFFPPLLFFRFIFIFISLAPALIQGYGVHDLGLTLPARLTETCRGQTLSPEAGRMRSAKRP